MVDSSLFIMSSKWSLPNHFRPPNCIKLATSPLSLNVTLIDSSHCRVEQDKSIRYVAAENIVQLFDEPSPVLMKLAGKYFKRWDSENGVFVSNVRDEYPDD